MHAALQEIEPCMHAALQEIEPCMHACSIARKVCLQCFKPLTLHEIQNQIKNSHQEQSDPNDFSHSGTGKIPPLIAEVLRK